ncbi:MAG: adenosylcobinamide-GDP ribazoletransferase [Parvibaculaceae bacterium]|nr:adenosylcobinamide-GDP ribazoletransferase [Parvibaculaceae bacterium]
MQRKHLNGDDEADQPPGAPRDWRDVNPARLVDDILVSLAFLTRLPLDVPAELFEKRPLTIASRAFPVAGAIIGLLGGLVYWFTAWLGLPVNVSAAITLAALLMITGAFHEDGLADVADGFGGGWSRERKLEIMRDSRLGTYGSAALICTLLLRFTLITAYARLEGGGTGGASIVINVLIASGAVSRCVAIIVQHLVPPARTEGTGARAGRPLEVTVLQAMVAAGIIVFLAVNPVSAVMGIVAALGAGAAVAFLAHRQIGGQTGDVLGATQQAAEVAFLIAGLMVHP